MIALEYKNIILRDYLESDIADEIRWFTKETSWMMSDTPWEPIESLDEAELKKDMLYFISETHPDSLRSRLEIETEGKHIGFVTYYMLDSDFEPIPYNQVTDNSKEHCALGIEICEPAFLGKGLGTQALALAIKYYQDNGYNDFCLETWSGNMPMLRCAEKLGFYVCKRKVAFRQVNGKDYDAVTLRLDNEKFNNYLGKK